MERCSLDPLEKYAVLEPSAYRQLLRTQRHIRHFAQPKRALINGSSSNIRQKYWCIVRLLNVGGRGRHIGQ
jgi:hypothetical protein